MTFGRSDREQMRSEKKEYLTISAWVSLAVAFVTLLICYGLHFLWNMFNLEIALCTPMTVFLILMVYAQWIYDKKIWPKKNRNRCLDGYWGYWLRDEHYPPPLVKIGWFKVEHDAFGIEVKKGRSHKLLAKGPNRQPRTEWTSQLAALQGNNLVVDLTVTSKEPDPAGERSAESVHRSMWILSRDGNPDRPPYMLSGIFLDPTTIPITHRGLIVARKISQDRIDEIRVVGEEWNWELINLAYKDCEQELREKGFHSVAD